MLKMTVNELEKYVASITVKIVLFVFKLAMLEQLITYL